MNATPETFKPGERWLMRDVVRALHDLTCLEWSPTLCFVRVFWNLERVWMEAHSLSSLEMVERLPDVESGNHKTEPARRLETDSLIRFARLLIVNWPCRCDHCKVQKAKAYTRTEEAESDIFTNAETKA